ncbi:unnamed protein product [Nippostrongylus brasiliensis]|uniref:Secreted protein n=1 Tax=Nippostrongylus brasiliensis TaxID=27835 RepID=A0A0N4Y669_NIPBR|nr:unnamed protein product [Nippostrongylus brasiliensis]
MRRVVAFRGEGLAGCQLCAVKSLLIASCAGAAKPLNCFIRNDFPHSHLILSDLIRIVSALRPVQSVASALCSRCSREFPPEFSAAAAVVQEKLWLRT